MAHLGSSLAGGQGMANNDCLIDQNGNYGIILQDDGNLVLCRAAGGAIRLDQPYWSAGANRPDLYRGRSQGGQYVAFMQTDGNFVLYNGTSAHTTGAYWATNTNRRQGTYVACMQTDGNFVLYNGTASSPSSPFFATNTDWVAQEVSSGAQGLNPGQWMPMGAYLRATDAQMSDGGPFAARLEQNGDLVFYMLSSSPPYSPDFSQPLRSLLGSYGIYGVGQRKGGPYYSIMQTDGNFVLYNGPDPGRSSGPYWSSNTAGNGPGQCKGVPCQATVGIQVINVSALYNGQYVDQLFPTEVANPTNPGWPGPAGN